MADAPPLVVVAGATATGKTELGIWLAEAFIAEGRPATVISADSRQVYRGLDIGTAKVRAEDRARAAAGVPNEIAQMLRCMPGRVNRPEFDVAHGELIAVTE